ncbi:hypothetical protein CLV29_1595 [Naumannella halotolerans]|uniref:UvrA DNA-binding domain-containing protein n=1 Tax=Naumannella halotolerans TaxID=993414 RepID=A0A4R7JBB9_9ACTN|nr:hypothetical protein CLV29_1595 [Naumannella halotolerans]
MKIPLLPNPPSARNGYAARRTAEVSWCGRALNRTGVRSVAGPGLRRTGAPAQRRGAVLDAAGACPSCQGTGLVRAVDDAALVSDPSKTIDDGAVVPWQMFGFNVQPAVAREFGVRTDVPWTDLTDDERQMMGTDARVGVT